MVMYIVLAIVFATAVVMAKKLYEKNRMLEEQQNRLDQLEKQLEQTENPDNTAKKREGVPAGQKEQISDLANVIHLYASLSAEEAPTEAYQSKQSEIIKAAKGILKICEFIQ